MLLELHSHSSEHSSCSNITAVDLVRLVKGAGINGIVITDHHYLWPEEQLATLRAESGLPDDFVILSGQEVFTSDFGDVLVYGGAQSFPQGISLAALRNESPDAALVWAHPYRGMGRPNELELFHSDLDAIEIINSHHRPEANSQAISDWRNWGFTATSGTDIHSAAIPAFYPTTFKTAITSIADLAEAIKRGDCLPTLPE
jgi:predicted metal-dependent phosphoesterase TrpH